MQPNVWIEKTKSDFICSMDIKLFLTKKQIPGLLY